MPRVLATLIVCLLACTACATTHLEPALPAERTTFDPQRMPLDDGGTQEQSITPPQSLVQAVQNTVVADQPVVVPTEAEWRQYEQVNAPEKSPKKDKMLVADANKLATVGPSKEGYAHMASSIQRYIYRTGVIFDVFISPQSPTSILLPPGERLSAVPMLNPDAFDVAVLESGEGMQRMEVILIRPVQVMPDVMLQLFTQSGLSFFCRLRSFPSTAMVAVAWQVPTHRPRLFPVADENPRNGFKPPQVDISRLHTGYTFAYDTERVPAWVPERVYDDGKQTLIKFREPLEYTSAPVLFAVDAKDKTELVQFTHYAVPEQPEKGAYYIVVGIHPILELRGQGLALRMIRQRVGTAPYQPVAQQ